MRSSPGVGITPPKVLGTPKPASSVMISSTLGAPLGGTMRSGQYGLDCAAVSLITPPNFGGGGGNCLPSMVVVALGEPGTPVICGALPGPATAAAGWFGGAACWAKAEVAINNRTRLNREHRKIIVGGRAIFSSFQ